MTELRSDPYRALVLPLDLGPQEGLRVAIKDCIDIAGYPTRAGSAAFEGRAAASQHADVVAALLDAGCRIIGKSHLHELAFGMTGINPHAGTPINPTWPQHIPGGSSSGSAVAVASGIADIAIGTDTGGSIRQPAICCGVIGFKPSFGRVSRRGAVPAASSLDCIGAFARDPETLIHAMVMIDPSFLPETAPNTPRLKALTAEIAPEIDKALARIGYHDLPACALPEIGAAFKAAMTLIAHETVTAHGALLAQNAPLGADIRARLQTAQAISAADLAEAEAVRARFTAAVDLALVDCDALITPAMAQLPPTLTEAQDPQKVLGLTLYIRPFNLSGHPAVVLPLQTATGGAAGVQLVGRKGQDAQLLALAQAFWHRHALQSASPRPLF